MGTEAEFRTEILSPANEQYKKRECAVAGTPSLGKLLDADIGKGKLLDADIGKENYSMRTSKRENYSMRTSGRENA